MAKPVLNAPQFLNEPAAFAYVEARLWPNGPVCPHCGETSPHWPFEWQDDPSWPAQVLRLQEALHGPHGHAV